LPVPTPPEPPSAGRSSLPDYEDRTAAVDLKYAEIVVDGDVTTLRFETYQPADLRDTFATWRFDTDDDLSGRCEGFEFFLRVTPDGSSFGAYTRSCRTADVQRVDGDLGPRGSSIRIPTSLLPANPLWWHLRTERRQAPAEFDDLYDTLRNPAPLRF
jgi:hypothetical protein